MCPTVNTNGSPTYNISKYLTGLLEPSGGFTEAYVRNSTTHIQTLDAVTLAPDDLLVSLDVVSLFTRVPLKPSIDLLTPLYFPKLL